MKDKPFGEIAGGDAAFRVRGGTLSKLFENAASAATKAMVDIETVASSETKSVELTAEKLEDLLYDFLSEIIYYKDAEQLLFSEFEAEVSQTGCKYKLKAELKGEKINRTKHKLKEDVKSATYHKLKVSKADKGYSATVILDI